MGVTSSRNEPKLEKYSVLADFIAETDDQLSISASELVNVLQKTTSGWWLVESKNKKGWVPSAYLDSDGLQEDEKTIRYSAGKEEEYLVIKRYEALFEDEVTLLPGSKVKVIEKTMDGWWLLSFNNKIGRAPAVCLKKLSKTKPLVQNDKSNDKKSVRKPKLKKPNVLTKRDDVKAIHDTRKEADDSKANHAISTSLDKRKLSADILNRPSISYLDSSAPLGKEVDPELLKYDEISDSDDNDLESYEEIETHDDILKNNFKEQSHEICSAYVATEEHTDISDEKLDRTSSSDEDGENYDDIGLLNKSLNFLEIPKLKSLHIPQPPRRESIKVKPHKKNTAVQYRAVADFISEDAGLSFQKDNLFELIQKNTNGWWFMKFKDSDTSGWVSSSYLVSESSLNVATVVNSTDNYTGYLTEVEFESTITEQCEDYSYSEKIHDIAQDLKITDQEVCHIMENGPEYTARTAFRATEKNHIDLLQGETVTLIDKSDRSWWYVKTTNGKGYVPGHFLKLSNNFESTSEQNNEKLSLVDKCEKPLIPSRKKSYPKSSHQSESLLAKSPPKTAPKPLLSKKPNEKTDSRKLSESASKSDSDEDDDCIYEAPLKSVLITRQKFTQRKRTS